jgi:hypothetical protein
MQGKAWPFMQSQILFVVRMHLSPIHAIYFIVSQVLEDPTRSQDHGPKP